jgi:hypothetical protein
MDTSMDTAPRPQQKSDTELFRKIRQTLAPWMTRRTWLEYLLWERAHHGRLSSRQRNALDDFSEQLQSFVRHLWDPTTPFDHLHAKLYDELRDAVKGCYKAGLHDYPYIAWQITLARGWGHWDWLRSVERGLERGMKRPYSMADMTFMRHFRDVRKSLRKPSLHGIHAAMQRRKFYAGTWRAFQKRCNHLWLSIPFQAK